MCHNVVAVAEFLHKSNFVDFRISLVCDHGKHAAPIGTIRFCWFV